MNFAGPRVHVVTGKGGTGKTTAAAALAIALASADRKVLLVEVEGRQGLSQAFDVPPLSTDERRLLHVGAHGEVFGLSIDAKADLLVFGMGERPVWEIAARLKAGEKIGQIRDVRFGAIDFATTIAPGVRDLLTIGKIYEADRRRQSGKHRDAGPPAYDAIVVDGPPTGRIGRFLNVGTEVADLAKVGPIRNQSNSITAMLQSTQAVVHLVTLLEEMPVQETVEAIAELEGHQLHVGAIIVNQVREALIDDSLIASAKAGDLATNQIRTGLKLAGLPTSAGLIKGLLREAQQHAERIDLETQEFAVLAETGRPLVELPVLPDGVDPNVLRLLADELIDQGMI